MSSVLLRFNDYNGARPSETVSQGTSTTTTTTTTDNTTELFAKSPETGPPKVSEKVT
jgi:hypothetical protein